MARIYSHDGYLAADAYAIDHCGESALEHACRIADEWDEAVELEDDDDSWHVYPAAPDGGRDVLPVEPE